MSNGTPRPPEPEDVATAALRARLEGRAFSHIGRALHNVRSLLASLPVDTDEEQLLDLLCATPDPDLALNGLERLARTLGPAQRAQLDTEGLLPRLARLAAASEYLIDSCSRCLDLLVSGGDDTTGAEELPTPFPGGGEEQLRDWHRRQILAICLREIEQLADPRWLGEALSRLADATAEASIVLAAEGGEVPDLAVVALGKWGGLELNFSSDIDLFFLRPDESDGALCVDVARRVLAILGGRGPGGGSHLYRTDLRLRPGGPAAPLVPTVTQARRELELTGGTWDRMVSIRARLACGRQESVQAFVADLERFVYEREFRAQDIQQVKEYKAQLERTLEGLDPHSEQIKVGWGGIRDVEYVVQFLQLLHGAFSPEIRGGNVYRAITVLSRIGALTLTEEVSLLDGYLFLRTVEHRLMIRQRLPNFVLPHEPDARRALATGLGFRDWQSFRARFDEHRARIRAILDRLFHRLFTGDSESHLAEIDLILAFRPEASEIERVLAPIRFHDPQKAYALLRRLAHPRRRSLQSPRARQFLAHLLPRLLARLAATPDPDQAVLLFTTCVETLGAPATFYQLLAEQPETCDLFVDLFASSRFISELLLDHPGILDEVLDRLRTGEKIEEEKLVHALRASVAGLTEVGRGRALQEFRAIHLVEIAVLDLAGRISVQGVLRRLSALARSAVRVIDELARDELRERLGDWLPETGRRPPRHVLLALGRLGGDEMGYASDLDMILIYDGEGRTPTGLREREVYTQLLQRILALLGNPGSGGMLYPVDLRLRPRGQGGALVHSFREFRSYFQSEESQVWEHQALVRSAPVSGDDTLAGEVTEFIRNNLGRGLDAARIRDEMHAMHARRRAEDARGSDFHLKTGPGGILDIEFLVQSAILLGVLRHPEVWQPNTQLAIGALTRSGLLGPMDAGALSAAYDFLRSVENRLSMMHRATVRRVPLDDDSLRDLAVRIGYQATAGEGPGEHLRAEIEDHTHRVREIFHRHSRP